MTLKNDWLWVSKSFFSSLTRAVVEFSLEVLGRMSGWHHYCSRQEISFSANYSSCSSQFSLDSATVAALVWAEIMPGRVTTAQRHSNVKSLWNSSNAWTNATSFKDVFEMNQSIKYTYHSFPLEQKHVKGVQLQLWRHPFTTRSLMISHPDIHLITHDQKFKDYALELYILRK